MTLFPISKNQPIDYATIEALLNKVNEIDIKVNLKSGQSSIDGNAYRTSDIVFAAKTVPVTGDVAANETKVISWDIGNNVAFKSPPVVTATILSDPATASANANTAFVSVSKVSISKVEVKILFTQAGPTNLSLNLIAIGTSNMDKT